MMTIMCVQAVAYGSSGMVQARQYPMACDWLTKTAMKMTTAMTTTTATAMMKMMMVMFCVQAVAYGSSGTVEATQYPMACDTNQTATYVPSSPYTGGTFVLAANRQYLSVCLYVCLSACLFVCLSVSELSKRRRRLRSERYPSVSSCLSVWVSVSASVFLPVSLSVTSSYAGDTLVLAISIALICLSIWVSVCLCVFLSLSACRSVCQSTTPSPPSPPPV